MGCESGEGTPIKLMDLIKVSSDFGPRFEGAPTLSDHPPQN